MSLDYSGALKRLYLWKHLVICLVHNENEVHILKSGHHKQFHYWCGFEDSTCWLFFCLIVFAFICLGEGESWTFFTLECLIPNLNDSHEFYKIILSLLKYLGHALNCILWGYFYLIKSFLKTCFAKFSNYISLKWNIF